MLKLKKLNKEDIIKNTKKYLKLEMLVVTEKGKYLGFIKINRYNDYGKIYDLGYYFKPIKSTDYIFDLEDVNEFYLIENVQTEE